MKLRDLTLDFHLDLGIARVHTAIFQDSINTDARVYVALYFEIWKKEIFRFRLYETGLSRYERGAR